MKSLFQWFFEEKDVNPFESPQEVEKSETLELKRLDREEKYRALGQLFWRWEKLRILYNAVLAIEVLVLTVMIAVLRPDSVQQIFQVLFCGRLVTGCLAANLLFLLGYYVNAYLVWMGFRQRIYTAILFLGGLTVAIGVTALAIAEALLSFRPF
jgi:hypothetical protein